jgi:hypothetical protein
VERLAAMAEPDFFGGRRTLELHCHGKLLAIRHNSFTAEVIHHLRRDLTKNFLCQSMRILGVVSEGYKLRNKKKKEGENCQEFLPLSIP